MVVVKGVMKIDEIRWRNQGAWEWKVNFVLISNSEGQSKFESCLYAEG